jgi:hypothetical protein
MGILGWEGFIVWQSLFTGPLQGMNKSWWTVLVGTAE